MASDGWLEIRRRFMRELVPHVERTLDSLQPAPDAQTYRRLRGLLLLLSMGQSFQFLKDSLGFAPSEAAETISWAILELTRAAETRSRSDDPGAGPAEADRGLPSEG
jgi:hypothetical protein